MSFAYLNGEPFWSTDSFYFMNNDTLPLRLGITGHRDLREADKVILRQTVRHIFQFLRQHDPDRVLELLSPLAEGADSLVAQVALEEKLRLIAPLPLPQHLYAMDFDTQTAQRTFTELLQQAQVIELPLLDSEASVSVYGEARNRQYAQVGAYVAQHSHVLIALWDGLASDKSGGTAQVVQLKLNGTMQDLPEAYAAMNLGAVCHVVTARKSGQALPEVGKIRVLLPHVQEVKDLEGLLDFLT